MDTNVLLRAALPRSVEDGRYVEAIASAHAEGKSLRCLIGQAREVYVVLTRKGERANGFGLSPDEANAALGIIFGLCPLLPDEPAWFSRWRNLVVATNTTGIQAHDAYLAAAAISLGCPVLTADEGFRRFPGLQIRAVDGEAGSGARPA